MMPILPIVADIYTPVMIGVWLHLLVQMKPRSQERAFYVRQGCILMGNVIVVYGIMLLDMVLRVWSSLGWDYSTHTAIVWAFIVPMWSWSKRRFWWSVLSLGMYGQLMWWLDYHTWADMISTSAVVVPILWAWRNYMQKKKAD